MTDSVSVILPRRSQSLLRVLVDHNPCFILSAVCMLAGCLALTNSLSWSPIPLRRVIILVITLNFYEFLLIGLAIFLITRRRLVRDGTILLVLEAFFLVDVTFLNAELFAENFRVGAVANTILLLLAVVKVTAIFRGLRIPLRDGSYWMTLISLTLLFTLPGVFKYTATHTSNSKLPDSAIYFAWWAIGCVPVLATILLRDGRDWTTRAGQMCVKHRHLLGMLMLLPVISLIAHVSTSNWIYNVRWRPANVSPLILGLAVALGAYGRHVISLATRMRAQLSLPILAIMMSLKFPASLTWWPMGIGISPLRLTLAGATLVYLHGLWLHRHVYFGWAACTCFLTNLFGASPQVIGDNLAEVGRLTRQTGRSLIPRTLTHWGIVSVVASFVLLALGAIISLMKSPPEEESDL